MTESAHYHEAERRLRMAWEDDRTPENSAHLVAEAQVHALLAVADAIRDTGRTDETCDAIRTEADGALIDTTRAKFYPCRRHLGHAGQHRDGDGDTW